MNANFSTYTNQLEVIITNVHKERLIKSLLEKGHPYSYIAKQVGCSNRTIKEVKDKFNLNIGRGRGREIRPNISKSSVISVIPKFSIEYLLENVRKRYKNPGLDSAHNAHVNTVRKWLDSL